MRGVLVIEELREAKLDLRHPEVERVLAARPGIGRLLVDSILQKDYLTVQALVLLITLIYATINLIVDLIYPLIDPRIAY